MDKSFTGDLDEMIARRVIRAGVTFNRTHYFIDRGQQRGITYESLMLFEKELNERLKTGVLKVHVAMLPMPRDQLYGALKKGTVDLVAAMVTVTPERRALVAFSNPTRTNVSQVVVTGPGAPPIATVDDLAGQDVFVRKAGTYHDSLVRLNAQLAKRGKAPVVIKEAPEVLEDDDVPRMVNAGLVNITVVDDYLAQFWARVFTDLRVHQDVALRSGGELAVAMRAENPHLRDAVNIFVGKHGQGDAFRNTVERVTGKREIRQERRYRSRAAEVHRRDRPVQEVRPAVRAGLPAHGRARLPGVDARSERQERGGRDRRDAGHAADRQGAQRRRHQTGRAQHPRRREVRALHGGSVLQ
jgi:membrane-bound lytic murein transglycosylase MltF